MVKYGFVVDLSRCMGCRACMMACKIENSTPEDVSWMYVFRYEEGKYPNSKFLFMPRPCMHCDNAPCVKVCPVGARYKREDGFVLTDFERCIGCRYCEVSCPYGVNFFNWKNPKINYYYDWNNPPTIYGTGTPKEAAKGAIPPYRNPVLDQPQGNEKRLTAGGGHFIGVIEKCTWCVHRVFSTTLPENERIPACVANCPVHALIFGDMEDPNSEVSKIISKKKPFRLLEELNTQPRVYYVGGTPPNHKLREE